MKGYLVSVYRNPEKEVARIGYLYKSPYGNVDGYAFGSSWLPLDSCPLGAPDVGKEVNVDLLPGGNNASSASVVPGSFNIFEKGGK